MNNLINKLLNNENINFFDRNSGVICKNNNLENNFPYFK